MHKKMRLVLAGGGTGGHIMPNIAIIDELKNRFNVGKNDFAGNKNNFAGGKDSLDLFYIGTRRGMEKEMMAGLGVPYKGIFCGKLRRYFSFRNLPDFFKLPIGIAQSFMAIRKFKPDLVFCKGGYVSFPVAVAARLAGKKVILHESDVIPGLANRLSARFASKIFVAFEETKKFFQNKKLADKVVYTGNPVRKWLNKGDKKMAYELTGFNEGLPVLFVFGGSQGAFFINEIICKNLERFLKNFQVIHICGKGVAKKKEELMEMIGGQNLAGRYFCSEFADKELMDLYAITDLFISRGGANSLAEIEYTGKPAVIIPLGLKASRGDQMENAKVFTQKYPAEILYEEDYNTDLLFGLMQKLLTHPRKTAHRQSDLYGARATDKIVELIIQNI